MCLQQAPHPSQVVTGSVGNEMRRPFLNKRFIFPRCSLSFVRDKRCRSVLLLAAVVLPRHA